MVVGQNHQRGWLCTQESARGKCHEVEMEGAVGWGLLCSKVSSIKI